MYLEHSLKKYIGALASEKPVPGGGGTSALVAALGIALALMVARISLKRFGGLRPKSLNGTIAWLERLRRNAEQVIDLDPKVYREVIASSRRFRKEGKSKKNLNDLETSLANSCRLQADLALLILMAKQMLNTVGHFATGSIRNDLLVSGALLDGAFRGSSATARMNVVSIKEGKTRRHFEQALRKLELRYGKIKLS